MNEEGFMIFAYNNEQHNYLKQAVFAADRITKFIKRPVTIVTNKETIQDKTLDYNTIITDAENKGKRQMERGNRDSIGTWHNANRNTAYELSPYNKTVVIDSDYIVSSARLLLLFHSHPDFVCHRKVFDISGRNSFDGDNSFGQFKVPHYWATVLYFKKSPFAKEIFENIAMIKEYWKFFGELYKFNTSLYRNDYAVSIALLMANGHRQDAVYDIPWRLKTAGDDVEFTLDDNIINFNYIKHSNGKERRMLNSMKSQDTHCLNKFALEKAIDANKS